MSSFQLIGAFISLIAVFGHINQRFIKLPDTLGITAIGVFASVLLALFGRQVPEVTRWATHLAESLDFAELVFHGMLGLLLFAGSLAVDFSQLRKYKAPIFVLATLGVLVSTLVIGGGSWLLFGALGHPVPYLYCMLLGALISPTDPIVVMGVLKKSGLPEKLRAKIVGESLFNDGTAVVAFIVVLGLATGTTTPSIPQVALLLAQEMVGGVLFGLACGFTAIFLLKGINSYPVEILITLALPTGGYALAEAIHVSAPLAVVVMGLVIGNHGAKHVMSATTREHLFSFWQLTDEVLTLALFGLIGMHMLTLDLTWELVLAGAAIIPLALAARAASVAGPLALVGLAERAPHTVTVLTWGGLRGGISIALALSIPESEFKPLLLVATYVIVLFSLLVQAPTLPWVLSRSRLSHNLDQNDGDSSRQP